MEQWLEFIILVIDAIVRAFTGALEPAEDGASGWQGWGAAITVLGIIVSLLGLLQVRNQIRRALQAVGSLPARLRPRVTTVTAEFAIGWAIHEPALRADPLPARIGAMTETEWLTLVVHHLHDQQQTNDAALKQMIDRRQKGMIKWLRSIETKIDREAQASQTQLQREGAGWWLIGVGSVLQIIGAGFPVLG